MRFSKAFRLAVGLGVALSAGVYGYYKFFYYPPLAPNSSIFWTIWGGALLIWIFFTESAFGWHLRKTALIFFSYALTGFFVKFLIVGFWLAPSNLNYLFPVLLWGAKGIPLEEPWYGIIGQFAYLAGVVYGGYAAFKYFFLVSVKEQRTHRRGRQLVSYAEATDRAQNEREKENAEGTIHWGWLLLPWSFGTKHFVACGSTGSGKTTLIRFLMQSVLPRVKKEKDERALIYDAKQDIVSILDGLDLSARVILLNPFDSRCAAWDIAADVTEPSTAQQIATILIPEEKNAAQRFFSDAARHLLAGVMRRFIKTASQNWTLADVVYAMLDQKRLEEILGGDPETASLLTYLQDVRTGNSVLSTVLTKMQPYEFIAAAWSRADSKVSLRDWVKGDYILILGNDEAQRSALDAINQAIFKRIVELVLAQENSTSRRTWFFLDEVREAGKLEGLQTLLTKGRSKGACVVLGFQDIDGMKEVYGEHLASEICGQCACKAFLRTDSAKTAEWCSALLGESEFVELTRSQSSQSGRSSGLHHSSSSSGNSTSSSEQIVKRGIVLPSEIMSLPLPGGDGKGPLLGYYLAPNIGAYKAEIDWNAIERGLLKPGEVSNLVRRDTSHETLRAWEEGDFERLGLKKTNSVLAATTETPSSPASDLMSAVMAIKGSKIGK